MATCPRACNHASVSPPFATPDLSSFILQAQASKAKIIGIAGGPPNNINEIKTAGEFGVMKGGQQMAALLALITDIHSLGLQAAQGLQLTTSFYWDMDDKTREWSPRVATGRFGAAMQVELVNDGPFTLVLDSAELERPRRG